MVPSNSVLSQARKKAIWLVVIPAHCIILASLGPFWAKGMSE